MGHFGSKSAQPLAATSGPEKDISTMVTDSADDLNEKEYRIVVTCKNDFRLHKNTPVTCTVGGEDERLLKVVAANRIYYNSPLPKPASKCVAKIEPKRNVDLLELLVTKTEPGYWTSKKK